MEKYDQYMAVSFNKKRGDIVTMLEGMGSAMLKLWALQNTKPHRATAIFHKETGQLIAMYIGQKDNLPRVDTDFKGETLYIDDLFEGLLEEIHNSEQ